MQRRCTALVQSAKAVKPVLTAEKKVMTVEMVSGHILPRGRYLPASAGTFAIIGL